jgi:hypothetical protein
MAMTAACSVWVRLIAPLKALGSYVLPAVLLLALTAGGPAHSEWLACYTRCTSAQQRCYASCQAAFRPHHTVNELCGGTPSCANCVQACTQRVRACGDSCALRNPVTRVTRHEPPSSPPDSKGRGKRPPGTEVQARSKRLPLTAVSKTEPPPKPASTIGHVRAHGNGGSGASAFCDPSGKCVPAPSAAPSTPPSKTGSSTCGASAPGPGATAIGEENCGSANAIPKTNGNTACFGYNAAHVLVPVDCSTPGAQTLVPAPTSSPAPAPPTTPAAIQPVQNLQSEITQQPSATTSAPQSSPIHLKPVNAKEECPKLDRNKRPCIQGARGSEEQGDWTIYKIDLTNSCECTCAVEGVDSTGRGNSDVVRPYSQGKVTCIHTPQGGCTGFQDELTYTCHR